MAKPNLSMLPTEILPLVAVHLATEDYAAFRLTCRRVESALFSSFARLHFTECHILRAQESIQTLVDISKSRMRSFVRCVVVSSEELEYDPFIYFSDGQLSHEASRATGVDREIFTEALAALTSLDTVRLRDGCNRQTKASHGQLMGDGRPLPPRCFGRRKFELGMRSSAPRCESSPLIRDNFLGVTCFHFILFALGRANFKPVRALESDFFQPGGLGQEALHIPGFMKPSVLPVLAQLQSLALQVHKTGRYMSDGWNMTRHDVERETCSHDLREFLGYTSRLEALHIDLTGYCNKYDGFVEWLASPPAAALEPPQLRAPTAVALSRLRRLSLGSMNSVSAQSLLSVVQKFQPTLQELVLSDVQIEASLAADTHLRSLADSKCLPNLWSDFLRSLTAFNDTLRYIRVSKPTQRHVQHRSRCTIGLSFAIESSRWTSFSYSGPEMGNALEGLAMAIAHTPWGPSFRDGVWEVEGRKSILWRANNFAYLFDANPNYFSLQLNSRRLHPRHPRNEDVDDPVDGGVFSPLAPYLPGQIV